MTERQLGVADESQSPPIDPRPPLLVKVTGYRLLDITLLLAFGIAKAVLTYWGRSVISAPLDWIMGTLIVIAYDIHGIDESSTEYCADCSGLVCTKTSILQYGSRFFIMTTQVQSSPLYKPYTMVSTT